MSGVIMTAAPISNWGRALALSVWPGAAAMARASVNE